MYVYKEGAKMEKGKAILASVLAGLIAPGSLMQQTQYSRITGSDLSRLRGDTMRVGQDFRNVISREKKASHQSARQAA
jgi:hypothetical protein